MGHAHTRRLVNDDPCNDEDDLCGAAEECGEDVAADVEILGRVSEVAVEVADGDKVDERQAEHAEE